MWWLVECLLLIKESCSEVCCFAVQFYGYLSQQQNMMQDYIRTSTYQRAMLENSIDFQDKVLGVYSCSLFLNCPLILNILSISLITRKSVRRLLPPPDTQGHSDGGGYRYLYPQNQPK